MRLIDQLFPDDRCAFRRELYPKHLEFFARQARTTSERVFIAGNRVGKTVRGR
jgi:hypothetical protein